MGKVKSIYYTKTFQVSNFHFDKIGVEVSVEPDETPDTAFASAMETVEALARKAYPHLFEDAQRVQNTVQQVEAPRMTIKSNQKPEQEQKPLLQLIQESKTVRELKSWHLLIRVEKNKKELQEAYDNKMEELTKEKEPA